MQFCSVFITTFAHCKKLVPWDTSEVEVVKNRVFQTAILVLSRGGSEFLGVVGTRAGVVLSFSVLVCIYIDLKL